MIKLHVKGTYEDAAKRARVYEIDTLVTAGKTLRSDTVFVATDDINEGKVVKWFADDLKLDAPFPPGSLIWYQHQPGKDLPTSD